MPRPAAVWTIGHSSRPIEAFLALLGAQGIGRVVDVRRYPGSRAHPHFNREPLDEALRGHGIGYVPFPELGGRRTPDPASRNTVWRNAAFRAYADFMETPAFAEALTRLEEMAADAPTAIMCSEAVWWRCHRALVADALKARGVRVLHIMDGPRVSEHPWTSAARIVDGRLVYGAAS